MNIDSKLRLLIVEDNEGFATLLKILLSDMGLTNLYVANDYDTGVRAFNIFAPNICIIDIDLGAGKKNGIQLSEKIREADTETPIIYLTSHYNEDYYENSRHTRPSAFMGKEISRFKLHQAIDLALLHHHIHNNIEEQILPSKLPPVPVVSHDQFFFKVGDIYKAIAIKEVSYFYAEKKITYARVGHRNYPTSVHLKTIEDTFTTTFIRIHKSYLANIALMEVINTKDGLVSIKGENLPIGNVYRKHLLETLPILR